MKTRTLIVSEGHAGHRLHYVRLIAAELLGEGREVVIGLAQEGIRSEEFGHHLNDLSESCRMVELPPGRLNWRSLRRLAIGEGCERIIVPDGDRWAMRLSARWPRLCQPHTTVLVTQDPSWNTDRSPQRRARLWIKRMLLSLGERQSGLKVVYLVAPGTVSDTTRHVAPDPVVFDAAGLDPNVIRTDLGLDPTRFWFLVAGVISERKNLPMVLSALTRLSTPRAGLLVAGPIEPLVRAAISPLLEQAAHRGLDIVLDDRVLSDHEINRAIQACDAVIVAYSTDSPNSMTAKGVRAGRVVVVAGSSVLVRWAEDLGIEIVGPLTLASLTSLLETALCTPAPPPAERLGPSAFARELL